MYMLIRYPCTSDIFSTPQLLKKLLHLEVHSTNYYTYTVHIHACTQCLLCICIEPLAVSTKLIPGATSATYPKMELLHVYLASHVRIHHKASQRLPMGLSPFAMPSCCPRQFMV
ncbi:hypothetical protein Dimus_001472 [Dionaea muscipula]